MAKLFLDTNILIDLIEKRRLLPVDDFKNFEIFFSPLSIHILAYVKSYKIPEEGLDEALENYTAVSFDDSVMQLALVGPTRDFEDNVQLHSAEKSDCEFFLTSDKELLKMKNFETVKIIDKIHK